MKKLFFCLMAMVSVLALSAQSVYDFKVKNDVGQEVPVQRFGGYV